MAGGKRRSPAFARFVAACFLLALTMALTGCTPSVRYTREKPGKQQPQTPAADPNDWGWGPDEIEQNPPHPQLVSPTPSTEETPDQTRKKAKKGPQITLLEKTIASYLGSPYKYGGMSGKGFDCSGFVITVYLEVYNKPLPRSSVRMWEAGHSIPLSAAKPGDLVFFRGGTFSQIDHVGVYMGNNRFAHSSTSKGVVYSDLKETYYSRRFAGVRRML